MKRNLLFIIAFFTCALSFGQGEIDAYRYSNNDISGTARGQAMGGAFGALGGDVTGVAINPAGIGIYRSSEVLANMSLRSSLTSGGNTNQLSNTKFSFDNLSYVSYYPLVKGSLLSLNFGFNYNRIKNFDQTYRTSGNASGSKMNTSMTDYMALSTNGFGEYELQTGNNNDPYKYSSAPWLGILGYDGYLINPIPNSNNQYASLLDDGEKVSPSFKVSEKGRVESYDFTIGSNIADKFYWGVTASITDMWYWMKSSYDEQFDNGGGFNLDNYLETKGSGFQLKAGVIFKPVDALRIGASYHSPTWYTLTDYYWAGLTPNGILADNGNAAGFTETPYPSASTDYRFRTPGSWTFSAAGVLATKAIISLDYEMTDYSTMNLKDRDGNDFPDNEYISSDFKNTSTIRAGFEFRFTSQLSGRLGYAWMQNPYRSSIQSLSDIIVPVGTIPQYVLTGDVNNFTAGIGFKFTSQFYGDFALVLRTQKDYLYYYPSVNNQNVVSDSFAGAFTNKMLKGLITLGYRF